MTFQLNDYLQRIGISRPKPTAVGLAQLQKAQLNAIAFENINPLLGVLPDLDSAALTKKLLEQGRGGYCFELNGLLGFAMEALGFDFEPIMARVWMGRSEGGPRHHLAYLVKADGETWLVDAGFGGPAPQYPLRANCKREQPQGHDNFRIRHDSASGEMLLEKRLDDGWFVLYGFDRAAVRRCDLEAANVLCATWHESLLSQNLLLCRNTDYGRIHLFNSTFSEFSGGEQASRQIETVEELGALIRNAFDIRISDAEINGIADRVGLASASCSRA